MELKKMTPWNWFKHEQPANQSLKPGRSANEPEHPLAQFHRGIDSLFDDLLLQPLGSKDAFFRPEVDVAANDKSYEINLDLPGLDREDVSVDVSGDVLTIRGQKNEETKNDNKHYYQVERRYGEFQRTLALPDDADPDDVQAELKNGVLHLQIPRRENAREDTRRIDIH